MEKRKLFTFGLFLSFSWPSAENVVDEGSATAEYVCSLITRYSHQNLLQNHDVALIKLELKTRNGVFDTIVSKVLEENPNNPVYVHRSSQGIIP